MTRTTRIPLLLLASLLALGGCEPQWRADEARKKYQESAKNAQALYEEKCRTVAGVKIYRTVPDVEGIVLLKLRPQAAPGDLADLMWPGAAFADESAGDGYISTFLGYEYSSSPTGKPVTPENRGYISSDRRPGGLPGYRYVDVIDETDGKRYRYKGRWDEPWKTDSSYSQHYVRFSLEKSPAPDPSPRYGVTFEDHVVPEERALGIASSMIKVIDLETQEVLGEMTRYARGATKASSANPVPWLSAYKCRGDGIGVHASTRKFVDQILIPKTEK